MRSVTEVYGFRKEPYLEWEENWKPARHVRALLIDCIRSCADLYVSVEHTFEVTCNAMADSSPGNLEIRNTLSFVVLVSFYRHWARDPWMSEFPGLCDSSTLGQEVNRLEQDHVRDFFSFVVFRSEVRINLRSQNGRKVRSIRGWDHDAILC